ncbi:PREDICTED: complement C5 [Nanorana parkeri]|uniref:complement C5 n=1 Tax=Nanorana parkeri TaxID=125878 RepID=UPI0008550228|nr:PREDICTED: complement C5 [Nanorana parkeri]
MILLQFAFLIALCGRSQSQEQTYLVTGPRLWRIGAQETVVIQAFGQKENFPIKISLLSFPDKRTTYAVQSLDLTPANNFQGAASLRILPNKLARKDGEMQYIYLQAQSKSFTKEEKVPVTYQNGFLFIQTDKVVYTPDQSVKIRVYSMDEELRPARRRVTLTIMDPQKVKMDTVTQDDATGVISFPEFKIPANPRYGLWTIEATYESDFVTSSAVKFEVKEYVLPRFFVTIEPERNFISYDTFKDFAVTVKAKYYYGRIVEKGKAFIRYGLIANGEKKMMAKSIEVLQIINGEAEFHFNSERSVADLQYSSLEELDGAYLYITATVEEEEGSQSEESENSNVKYILTPYRLTLIATPLFVKPTLPYHIKVLVKDTLDNPTARIPLTLSGEFTNENGESAPIDNGESIKQRTDIKGTSVFVINIPAGVTALDFRIKTDDPNLQEENQAEAEFKATSYKSLTESYLYIDWARESRIFQVGSFLNVNIFPKSPYLHKLTHYSYLIISKGKILQYNTVERVPGSVSQYLNIQITSSMVPSFRLLVYYIVTGESTAELIADSIWVEVQENCLNSQKIQLSTSGGTFKPKENVTLNINAQTGSIVALSAVDVAIYDVTKKFQRPLERVLRKIEESDLGCGAGAGQNNVDVFQTAGLTFITNANIQAAQNTDPSITKRINLPLHLFPVQAKLNSTSYHYIRFLHQQLSNYGQDWKCDAILRSKRSLEDEIKKEAGKFHNESVKKCCMDGGTNLINEKECKKGVERVERRKPSFPLCAKVFAKCCQLAKQLKEKLDMEHKELQLGRMYIKTVFNLEEPEIRSYFPESWLWEEHAITDRYGEKKLQVSLPDSLTTWEVQGVGMSDKGICVADPLSLTVFKDLFLDVQLPYSVVRGEQVQIKVVVYNYQAYKVTGCVRVSVTKEVCLVSDSSSDGYRNRRGCQDEIHPLTPKIYTYNLLPLELGLHPVTFTLHVPKKEIVIKTLRVVPEGIQEENSMGFTLDPQGIRGIMKRNEDVAFKIPVNIVPKSKINRILSINGNILGEVIDMIVSGNSIQTLVNLPKGSAETELMRVAPIFYVYHYLDTKNEWSLLGPNTFMIQIEMQKKLKDGVSSILAFRNGDHSYSLRRDSDPSTWLTAFALRTFGEIQKYVSLDHMSVCNSLIWLIEKCQSRDGSFQEKSSTNLVKLQGTIPREAAEKTLYLTAYVIIAIQKSLHMCPLNQISNALELAIDYVSRQASSAQTMYTMAVCAYALHISESTLQSKHQTIAKIKGEALTKGISFPPAYRYWKDTLNKFDQVTPSVETAMMVETTAYTLLAILKSGDYEYAKPVARWLKEQQRYGGGFFSTQDTVMALEALTEVGILEKKLNLNMDVTVSYRRAGEFKNYRLTERNPFTKPVEVPILEDLIISTRSAYGIATGNVRTVYNIISPPQENCRFDLKIQKKLPCMLTAFALRTFGEIQKYVSLDHMSVCNSLIWLIEKCQSRDGSFQEKSSTNLVKLQGTIPREAAEKTLYLTAYVIIAIQKSLHMCPLNQISNALELAIDYVSRQASSAQTMYTMAVCAYALHISESTLQSKHQTIAKIKGEALTKGISFPPAYRYWKDTLNKFDQVTPSVETAMMVETTAYTLLAILKSGDYEYAKPVARWLKEQQRYGGGFFSTQDTVMALEALTEVGILEKKLNLNMDVTVSYRRAGEFKNYRLTERNPFTKPVEVPILEDLIISTRSAYGIATGNVRTVYNIISPPQENCRFDLKIQKKLPSEDQSIFSDDNSQALFLEVCAKYKPKKNENVESGQVVMEITLVTGLIADEKNLNELINRVDQYVVDYSLEDGKVVLHFDWIGSDEYICATLLVRKMFKVALISPGIFKVYELRAPDQACTTFYNPYADDNLVRVCTGDTCKCIEGECPKLKSKLDMTTTAEQRKNVACKGDVTYAYKVQIVQLDEDGDFLKYTAKILDIFNKGTALVKVNKQIRFIKKNTCSSFDMENGQQYLIMGKDGIQIRQEREFHYEYPLDSNSWIEWWPDVSCTSLQCNRFLGMLEDFTENILLEGCQ